MFISPQTAIQNNWIRFPSWMTDAQKSACIQPNAIDITLDKLFAIEHTEGVFVADASKKFYDLYEMGADDTNKFTLQTNAIYDVMSDFYVEIPEGVAAELVIRSTLNRVGLTLNSGLWDSGYKGNIGCVIHNRGPSDIQLEQHVRMCQIKFVASQSVGTYAGQYNTANGQHWSTTQRDENGVVQLNADPARTQVGMGPIVRPTTSPYA